MTYLTTHRPNVWATRLSRCVSPRLRLFCFPFAGASGAVYRSWPESLADRVDVWALELPGRWQRRQEPLLDRVAPIVSAVATSLTPLTDVPFAFYGHSFGALLAFEVTRALRHRDLPQPTCLMVGAQRAPHLPRSAPLLHPLSDQAFLLECSRRYGGIDERLLEDEEMLEVIVPPMRADITALETYVFREEPPLACPLAVWGGVDDVTVSETSLHEWARHSTSRTSVELLPGGHLFMKDEPSVLLSRLQKVIG